MEDRRLIPILLLNWNGSKDTIDCLQSLYEMNYHDFFVVIVDNGSSDDSLAFISSWLKEYKKINIIIEENVGLETKVNAGDCIIYALKQNYGFAKGNNLGLELIHLIDYQYVLFLNNDTIVELDFLREMLNFQIKHPNYKALTPLIRYFNEKNKIWNAGGRIFLGMRKYYYADSHINEIKERNFIPITFVTGCALFVVKDLIVSNKLFTEKFFFGEEDFDFSLRMKKERNEMACVLDAQIYHKVSSSTTHMVPMSKVYLYYLNRFINVRFHYGPFFFFIWKNIYALYIVKLLKGQGYKLTEIYVFIKNLFCDSLKFQQVDKQLFQIIINK